MANSKIFKFNFQKQPQKVFYEEGVLKIVQHSQKNTCAGVFF